VSQRVVRSIRVRRPVDEVAAFVTDPHQVLPVVPGFARFAYVGAAGDGSEEWDVFLEIGTLHVGGRVEVSRPSPYHLAWRSGRGTRHRFDLAVEPVDGEPDAALVRMELEYALSGLLMARVSELLAKGIVARHLEAGLEEVRHRLEHGDVLPG
jgi:carbon monoxide dehydrogenase subunit G